MLTTPDNRKPPPQGRDSARPQTYFSQVTILAMAGALLHTIGFLATRTFIVALAIPEDYAPEVPTTYLLWGAKAITAILSLVMPPVVILGVVGIIAGPSLKRLSVVVRERLPSSEYWRMVLAVLAALVPLGMTSLVFPTILAVCLGMYETPVPPQSSLSTFASDRSLLHLGYVTLIAGALVLTIVLIRGVVLHHPIQSRIRRDSAVCVLALVAASYLQLLAMPYRLMFHNEFETVSYAGRRAFVLGRRDSSVVLYRPGDTTAIVGIGDALLTHPRPGRYRCIFDADSSAARGAASGPSSTRGGGA